MATKVPLCARCAKHAGKVWHWCTGLAFDSDADQHAACRCSCGGVNPEEKPDGRSRAGRRLQQLRKGEKK
jgi:hypothetical protein